MPAAPCREQIVAAVQAALVAASLGPTVERNRHDPIEDAELNLVILFEGSELPSANFSGEDGYQLSLLLQAAIKGRNAAAATSANTLRAGIIKALLADVTLGGLARNLLIMDPGDWIGTPTVSDDTEGFVLQADVTYATKEGDPFTFASD